MRWVVHHGNDNDTGPHETPIGSVEELDALLDQLDADARAEGPPPRSS